MTNAILGQAKEFLSTRPSQALCLGIIGDVALDRYVQGSVDRISPEAPVPVLLIENTFEKMGCAANVVENLLSLETPLKLKLELLGLVGQDAAGDQLREQLKSRSPALRATLLSDPSRPTIQKTRFLAGSQHQLLRVDSESTLPLDSQTETKFLNILEEKSSEVQGWIVQDYAKGLVSLKIMQRLKELCKTKKVPIFVDPHRQSSPELYHGVTVLTPNVAESEALLGRSLGKGADDTVVSRACADLKTKLDLQMVLMTRSQYGMTLLDRENKIHHFPAISRAVFDVTGAGDTVVAVFASTFLRGASLSLAGTLATAAASVVVAKVGTATASADEILAELDHFPC